MDPLTPRPRSSSRCAREDLAALLPEWEGLEAARRRELEAHAGECPSCASALDLLRRAQAWLASPDEACPPAEDLFDFARAPGALVLAPAARQRVSNHVQACSECRGLLATLAQLPAELSTAHSSGAAAAPIAHGPVEAPRTAAPLGPAGTRPDGTRESHAAEHAAPAPERLRAGQRAPRHAPSGPAFSAPPERPIEAGTVLSFPVPGRAERPERWVSRALGVATLAASLAALVFLWRGLERDPRTDVDVARAVRFPEATLLRGDEPGAVLYPRQRVLADAAGALVESLWIELAPQPRASAYRVRLLRRPDEVEVARVENPAPAFVLDADSARALTPGRYTLEAWAEVDGLDVPMGRRDFQVRSDPELCRQIERLAQDREPARSERAMALLVELGYECDARAWARRLPASAARDAWLARRPGR